MNVLIMHPKDDNKLVNTDAVMMSRILGKTASVFVLSDNESVKLSGIRSVSFEEALSVAKDPNAVIICHHSGYWRKGYELLKQAEAKIIFKFHGIVPPYFFSNFSRSQHDDCLLGMSLTRCFQEEFPNAYWFCDSGFSAGELHLVRPERVFVVPPFNGIEDLANHTEPEHEILARLNNSDTVNLFYEADISPDKGHLLLLDILYAYCQEYGRNIVLRLAGRSGKAYEGYRELLNQKIQQCDLQRNVEFVEEASSEALAAYYQGSDILLCPGLHEDFCLPIAKAQFFGLPVLALRCSGVYETAGREQLLLGWDLKKFVAAIKIVKNNKDIRDYLVEKAKENFKNRFNKLSTEKAFLKAFNKAVSEKTEPGGTDMEAGSELNASKREEVSIYNDVFELLKKNIRQVNLDKNGLMSNEMFVKLFVFDK